MKYKIVMDSAGNLLSLDNVDYSCAPLKIRAGEREFVDDAGLDLDDMIHYLRGYKGRSTSACPSVGEYLEAFGDAENVYCITITSSLSGSYNAAKAAAGAYKDHHPERNVHVFDSLSAGPEMALLAEKIRELVSLELDHESIVQQGYEYMKRTRLVFSMESLHNMAVNGRVPGVVAKATGILGIRLIAKASESGTLQPAGKARGESKVTSELVKHMLDMGYNGGRVRIHHCLNRPGAECLQDLLHKHFPEAEITIDITKGLCSFYAEQGGILTGFEV